MTTAKVLARLADMAGKIERMRQEVLKSGAAATVKASPAFQRRTPIGLGFAELNQEERMVMRYLVRHHDAKGVKLAEMEKRLPSITWVRNALRRPRREQFVERIDDGTYRATAKGRKAVSS
jgi:hypothetical protein